MAKKKTAGTAAKESTPTSKKQGNSSKSWVVLVFSICVIIVAIVVTPQSRVFVTRHLSSILPTGNGTSVIGIVEYDDGGKVDTGKYASEVVNIIPQQLLQGDNQNELCQNIQVLGEIEQITDVMQLTVKQREEENVVFAMLNGKNEGVYVTWNNLMDDKCLYNLAYTVALTLGVDEDRLDLGLRLLTQYGEPVVTQSDLNTKAQRIVHVLLNHQLWTWPGIKVGHAYHLERNISLTTVSLIPIVYSVENFFNGEEADRIIKIGTNSLSRSPVDSTDAVDGYHSDRTSDTAFLDDSQFTRDFRKRTAEVGRLPSPSFVERLQLVRYKKGQFFRKHEDYFASKNFVLANESILESYKNWTIWAGNMITNVLSPEKLKELPTEFLEGGIMFPDFQNVATFEHAILSSFLEDGRKSDLFFRHADKDWEKWIDENVENGAHGIVGTLLPSKGYMLKHIVRSWELRAGLPELRYTFPKSETSGVTQYFHWIRWAKEKVSAMLLSSSSKDVPLNVQPNGGDYPTYFQSFQNIMLDHILADFSSELKADFGQEFYDWMVTNKKSSDILLVILRKERMIMEYIVNSWAKRGLLPQFKYTIPKYVKHFEPNRYLTVFLYLNTVEEGGETVFPYSKERIVTDINREGMAECSEGLAVPARRTFASLFYSQTPENDVDPMSLHGGCPPAKGTKYGANSFTWNADAEESANAWDLGVDYKEKFLK